MNELLIKYKEDIKKMKNALNKENEEKKDEEKKNDEQNDIKIESGEGKLETEKNEEEKKES